MNRVISALIAVIAAAGFVAQPAAAAESRPLVLVFETTRGEGADKDLAAETTRAIRDYLRETKRVEATVFDRESPTVLRAIMEKMLTPDKVASYASQDERIEVARILGFQYAAGAEVSVKNLKVKPVGSNLLEVLPPGPAKESGGTTTERPSEPAPAASAGQSGTEAAETAVVEVKLWMARVGGGKRDRWEVIRSSQAVGTRALDLRNAMHSAASAAVLSISRIAFAQLPAVSQPEPATGTESTAIGTEQPPATARPTASEYAARAEQSMEAGNLALAIEQFKRAVDANPTDPSIRIKLAEAYARRGMYKEAEDELARAKMLGGDEKLIADAQARLERLKSAQIEVIIEPERETRVSLTPAKTSKSTGSAVAKMIEGDKLWQSGKPDEAAEAYKEAIKLDPKDWRAYERLAAVNASMSLFGESRKALEQLASLQPDPPSETLANRYELFRSYFDTYFNALIRQYDAAAADFEKKIISRESYYNTVKGIAMRLELMASFLNALQVPPLKKPAHI
ncbi:MAG: tetratricopeptide repeat protein, partial [Armatimonadota bacterium]|nr:tetratricopeptide repeat protein [Armatimonadota bacterium]